jgi:hypothetical protein
MPAHPLCYNRIDFSVNRRTGIGEPTMRATAVIIGTVLLCLLAGVALAAPETGAPALDEESVGRTPPRLSYLDGQVSFWRPGADDWVQAQVNTALAPGDQLFIQGAGNLELQVGTQAFVRGGMDAQIELVTQEPDFLRFKAIAGRISFDLRTLGPGRTVEVDTPHAAFTIDHEGYYRLDIDEARTAFIARRTGRATAVASGGEAVPVESGEAVVIQGPSEQNFAFQAAPGLDDWDNWNYTRTDDLLAARSLRYVSPETYGAGDLDRYGSWRVLPEYGPVWVPSGVASDWAPYSTGSWMYDPYYGWTWVDTAPWGWAPYHYGRWVYVNSYWGWAPGPVVARPYYAPALVAFFGGPAVSVGISIGGPGVGWVALGWGEPLIPWWGRTGFIHRPWWGGWGGPRCINNKVIHRRTIVTVNDIHVYNNSRVRHALVVVDKDHFGRGSIRRDHRQLADAKDWRPIHRAPDIRPSARSYTPSMRRGTRPPEKSMRRSVVTVDPHSRIKSVTIREPGTGFRPEARSVQGNPRLSQHDRSGTLQPSKDKRSVSVRPAPARIQQTTKAVRMNGGENMERRPERAPDVTRPMTRHSNRSVSNAGPREEPVQRPALSPSLENPTGRGDSFKSADQPASIRRPLQQNRTRIEESRPETPAAVPRINGGNRFGSRPAAPAPTVQVPRRQLPQPDVSRPVRIAPAPGSDRRPEPSRQVNRDEQRDSGDRNPGIWQRSERPGRPEMNRGDDFNSRGGFQRRSRN